MPASTTSHLEIEEFDTLQHLSNDDVLLPDDLDGVGPGPMPGSHFPVALGDARDGEVPESYLSQMPKFLILIGFLSVISSTDTISILSGGLLDLPELSQEVPEARVIIWF